MSYDPFAPFTFKECEVKLYCNRDELDKWYEEKYNEFNGMGVCDFAIDYHIIWSGEHDPSPYDMIMRFSPSLTKDETKELLSIPFKHSIKYWDSGYAYSLYNCFTIYKYEGVKSGTKSAAKTTQTTQTN